MLEDIKKYDIILELTSFSKISLEYIKILKLKMLLSANLSNWDAFLKL